MRILPFIATSIVTVGLVSVLNIQLTIGKTQTPKLGYFLSPQHGFWKNAEKLGAGFDASIEKNRFGRGVILFLYTGENEEILKWQKEVLNNAPGRLLEWSRFLEADSTKPNNQYASKFEVNYFGTLLLRVYLDRI